MRGILHKNKESKIYADVKTYDSKLYTFKECDYKVLWHQLDIMVKQLDEKTSLKNIPSARENKKKNNRMIDKALEKHGVPIPELVGKAASAIDEDDDSDYSDDDEASPQNVEGLEINKDDIDIIMIKNNLPIGVHHQPSARGNGINGHCSTDGAVKIGCSLGGGANADPIV